MFEIIYNAIYMKFTGVARIFQQGGPKRGSETTEQGEGREILWKCVYENGIFLHIACHY